MAEGIFNPFSGQDEIIFKDEKGNLQVLKGDEVKPAGEAGAVIKLVKPVSAQPRITPAPAQAIPPAVDYAALAQALMQKLSVKPIDEPSAKRLGLIMVSRLRGVRDMLETREILLRSSKIGGMGFTENEADEVMRTLESAAKSGMVVAPAQKAPPVVASAQAPAVQPTPAPAVQSTSPAAPAPPAEKKDILKLIQDMPEFEIFPGREKPAASVPPVHSAPGPSAPPAEPAPRTSRVAPAPFTSNFPPSLTRPAPPAQPAPVLAPAQTAPRPEPAPEVVRKLPKLLGPVEELREIDVIEFRRLAPDPVSGCRKIVEKLSFLEKDSFAKKAQGIAAWRQSSLYQLYVEIGKASMLSKTPIDAVAEQRKRESKPYLTMPEFEAIMDLNEQIRF